MAYKEFGQGGARGDQTLNYTLGSSLRDVGRKEFLVSLLVDRFLSSPKILTVNVPQRLSICQTQCPVVYTHCPWGLLLSPFYREEN